MILSAQGEKVDHIRMKLEAEEAYQELEVLKSLVGGTVHPPLPYNFLTDRSNLLMEIMTKGAPSIEELQSDFKKISLSNNIESSIFVLNYDHQNLRKVDIYLK